MLEFLKFSIDGYFSGNTKVEVNVAQGFATVTVDSTQYPDRNGTKTMKQASTEQWVDALMALRIGGWKSLYEPEVQILDGESWSLEYKELNKRCRHISGMNAYPEDWQKFIDLMDKISPMVPPKQIDLLRMRFTKMELVPIDIQMGLGKSSSFVKTDESFILDRTEEAVSFGMQNNMGSDVLSRWIVPWGVAALLDRCQAYLEDLTPHPNEFEPDVPSYELTIGYHDGTGEIIKGMYKQNDLPIGWPEVAQEVAEFIEHNKLKPMMLQPQTLGEEAGSRNEGHVSTKKKKVDAKCCLESGEHTAEEEYPVPGMKDKELHRKV